MSTATAPVICAFHISPASVKDYSIDVSRQLQDATGTVVDSVASVEWLVDPNTDIQLTNGFISGNTIGFFAGSAKVGQAYRVTARVTTNSNPPRVFEEPILLACIEKAGRDAQVALTVP